VSNNKFSTTTAAGASSNTDSFDNYIGNYVENLYDFSRKPYVDHQNCPIYNVNTEVEPSLKRRKSSASTWESSGRSYNEPYTYENAPSNSTNNLHRPSVARAADANDNAPAKSCKRDRSIFEEDEVIFMSRDEIERCSPSRKDGINALHETHLRYTYCGFLQNLGIRLELPQTTIGTAMVLCHRFFVRRSHACHDRFLVATAALFLAAKSEETACPLNNVLRVSSELYHKQDLSILSYLLPIDWFEKYRERVLEAEQMILTTLNFELNVQHPYIPLTSTLNKLGLSQSMLVNLALSLVSEGVFRGLACSNCMIYLAAGLICCCCSSIKFYYLSSEVELAMFCGCFFYEFTITNGFYVTQKSLLPPSDFFTVVFCQGVVEKTSIISQICMADLWYIIDMSLDRNRNLQGVF
jgi:cyclin T